MFYTGRCEPSLAFQQRKRGLSSTHYWAIKPFRNSGGNKYVKKRDNLAGYSLYGIRKKNILFPAKRDSAKV